MRRSKLDRIDRKILKNLQNDGRMSNVDLAKEVGISAPPCLRRVRALEDAGFIKGYHADINASSLGFSVTVFALVTLKGQSTIDKEEFENHIATLPQVRECNLVAGELDYILKIVAKDWDDYQDLLKKELTSAPHVNSVKSCLSMSASKIMPGVPISDE
jgi:DNA-binding Lrp family transcriptional regulator